MAEWARENVPELIRQGRGKRETDKFINYWRAKSGKDATKLDWVATWRNWMLNAEERLAPQAPAAAQNGSKSTGAERAQAAIDAGRRVQAMIDGRNAS